MIALYLQLGDERTARFTYTMASITIGSGQENELVLRDGDVAPWHLELAISDDGEWMITCHAAVSLEGTELPKREPVPVRDGAKLVLGQYSVVLALNEPALSNDPVEARLLADILHNDHASRDVYADWLEGHGRVEQAEFLRLQEQLAAGAREPDPTLLETIRELCGRPAIGFVWRRRVSRPSIADCTRQDCPRDWGMFAASGRPDVRSCLPCGESVRYCSDWYEAKRRGGRVVVDLAAQPRAPRPAT